MPPLLSKATEGALRAERETRVEKPFLSKLLNPFVRIKRQKRVNRALASSVHAIVPILNQLLEDQTRAREELEKRVDEQFENKIGILAAKFHSYDNLIVKLQNIAESKNSKEEKSDALQSLAQKAQEDDFDLFYLAFENKFRGSREDIRERQKAYLPHLEELSQRAALGREELKILDIGCGRGEWLGLLRDEGYSSATGVDLNATMVKECQQRSLPVKQQDALEYLKNLPDESLHSISGFHIIEHLPFEVLMRLYREAFRVLVPGGFAFFETPNPENVQVGTCNFHNDPTHQAPLPPAVQEFIFEYIGFSKRKIKRSNPYPDSHLLDENTSAASVLVNEFFFGPQDYAIIGYK